MTEMEEVVHQIEAVLDDDEYPATLDELLAMRRILAEITAYCTDAKDACPQLPGTAAAVKHRFFPDVVFNSLRDYEKRRHAPGMFRQAAGTSCMTM
ncbi:MAG: hypothetical protein WCE46_08985 [Methanoregula sp.]|jgi:hypothetical protein|uniref:hypothetical protein n=1 Tax=Methanoregula sp. TaxID=2052170 RepID=UPI003C711A92